MSKHHKLIVQDRYSLSNETDEDAMSDYFPGVWAVKSQKAILKFAQEALSRGDTITVDDYNNPEYHSIANKFIKKLGLKQPLFTELPKNSESLLSVIKDDKKSAEWVERAQNGEVMRIM